MEMIQSLFAIFGPGGCIQNIAAATGIDPAAQQMVDSSVEMSVDASFCVTPQTPNKRSAISEYPIHEMAAVRVAVLIASGVDMSGLVLNK
jgi:hypothetical protein